MFNTDPMPGENFENAAEREKARAEQEAIANGENFNPNISNEDAEKFNNLENEVPFAGDNPYGTETYQGPETVVGNMVASEYDADKAPDLEGIKDSVDANYISGAAEQVFNKPDAMGAAAVAVETAGDNTNNPAAAQSSEQPKAAAITSAEMAIALDSQSEDLADELKTGNADAALEKSQFEENAQKAQEAIDSIDAAIASGNADKKGAEIARNIKAQAQEMVEEANEAVAEGAQTHENMSDEDKEVAKAAEEAAEEKGTTFEEELANFEEAKRRADEEAAKANENLRDEVKTIIAGGFYG